MVSRTLIDKKTGTVTLFAFDENQGLSEHTAPFDAMVYVLEGEIELTISGKPFTLKQGEMTILPANQPHALSGKNKVQNAPNYDKILNRSAPLIHKAVSSKRLFRRHQRVFSRITQYDKCLRLHSFGNFQRLPNRFFTEAWRRIPACSQILGVAAKSKFSIEAPKL